MTENRTRYWTGNQPTTRVTAPIAAVKKRARKIRWTLCQIRITTAVINKASASHTIATSLATITTTGATATNTVITITAQRRDQLFLNQRNSASASVDTAAGSCSECKLNNITESATAWTLERPVHPHCDVEREHRRQVEHITSKRKNTKGHRTKFLLHLVENWTMRWTAAHKQASQGPSEYLLEHGS